MYTAGVVAETARIHGTRVKRLADKNLARAKIILAIHVTNSYIANFGAAFIFILISGIKFDFTSNFIAFIVGTPAGQVTDTPVQILVIV